MVKKALLVGIQYNFLTNTDLGDLVLGKAHEDIKSIKNLLAERFNYNEASIVVMTDAPDQDPSSPLWPNKANLVKALKALVYNAQDGDGFLFYFAGHGSQQKCPDNSEKDGLDELIWPFDVVESQSGSSKQIIVTQGLENIILDDDLKKYLVDPLQGKSKCKLLAMMDCCHSGTSLDLLNTFNDLPEPFSPVSKSTNNPVGPKLVLDYHGHNDDHHEGEHPGDPFIVSLSACLDPQLALDLRGGRLCYHLKDIIEKLGPNLTYKRVYDELCQKLGQDAYRARKKLKLDSKTKPQLCSSLPLQWVWNERFEL